MFTIGTILDTFSEACFSYEAKTIPLHHQNFSKQLQQYRIDLVLVESTWRGPNGGWRMVLANRQEIFRKRLIELKKTCDELNIPILFWNKEDPPHFHQFLRVAQYFDYVMTTDLNCVTKYKEKLGHNKIDVLQFAAQPNLHYPSTLKNRVSKPCFAGSYRGNQYKHRVDAVNKLLDPLCTQGLCIYDRFISQGKSPSFPKKYRKYIIGGLAYKKLVEQYRKYRFFINIDSVMNSPTMFSRRVFELLACGTPVISTPSIGVKTMFPGIVRASTSRKWTLKYAKGLMENDSCWADTSIAGIRAVLGKHTYAHRLAQICAFLGIETPTKTKNRIVLFNEGSKQATTHNVLTLFRKEGII